MPHALVCSADNSHRYECGVACEACRFLISERRSRRVGKVPWFDLERRSLSNLLPFPAIEYAGVPAAACERESERSSSWYLFAWLALFNLLDCLFTIRALSMGYSEGNPVMAALIEVNLPLAMLSKAIFVGLGAFVIWRFRHLKVAARGLVVMTAVYGLLVLYHISFQLAA